MTEYIKGLTYDEECIDVKTEQKLLIFLDKQEWNSSLKRRTQHYGFEYDYSKPNTLHPAKPVPKLLQQIANHFIDAGTLVVNESNALQCIVNEYMSGQCIAPHTDARIFGPVIVGLSIGSATTMRFERDKGDVSEIELKPRSIYTMSDDARYKWKHSIPRIGKDPSFRRISITYRTVPI